MTWGVDAVASARSAAQGVTSVMKKLATGLGAVGLVFASWLPLAQAQGAPADAGVPQDVIVAGTGGFAGFGGTAGVGGMVPNFDEVRVVNGGAGIPIGGGLLVQSNTGSAPIVEVADSATPNTTLGGTLVQLDFSPFWVWTPTVPLTEGTTYSVRLSSPDLGITGITDSFTAVAPIAITQPSVSSEPSVSAVSETFNAACCRAYQFGVLQDTSCFPNQQRRSVILDPGFSTADPAVLLNQFLFRMGPAPGTAVNAPLTPWSSLTPMWFTEQAQEYCYELEAIEIISRTVYTYDDLESCVPHGDLAELGVVEVEPGAAELDHLVCQAPPDQYKDQWCDLNEDPCADDAMATACGLYGFVCRGEDLPPDPFSMTGGFSGFDGAGIGGFAGMVAGAGGTSGVGGSTAGSGGMGGASGMSEDPDAPSEPSHGGGCSVGDAGEPRSGGALGWGLLAAALFMAKRRKR